MQIVVCTDDSTVRDQVVEEITALGHEAQDWILGDPTPLSAHLIVIDGIDTIANVDSMPIHVLGLMDSTELSSIPADVDDIVLKPLRDGELRTRLHRLCERPSRQREFHNRLLAGAIDRTSDVIELTNAEATLEYVNPAYEQTLGLKTSEVIGKTPAELVRSEMHPPEYFAEIGRKLSANRSWSGTLISRAKSGHLVHFDTTISPVTDHHGEVTHHVAVKRDITDRPARDRALEETNRALEQARDAALAASKAKSEFLANMSHELRTPLNAVIGYSEMLMDDHDGDAQVMKDLGRIHSAGAQLLALINDVLDLSKIEAKRMEIVPEKFALDELLESLRSTMAPNLLQKENAFSIFGADNISEIYADKTRLRQVLLNLLSNANKFTDEGSIELKMDVIDDGGVSWAEFCITDTGIGVSAEQQKKLFQSFAQADTSTTREYGGTGLGLVISRRLCAMMNGTITMASELGVGTTLTVRLPMLASPDVSVERADGESGRQVLLIDDDETIHDLFHRHLRKQGFRVHWASSGAEGIQLASQLKPDAIVLDVKMPGMSGWDVLSALKLSDATTEIPVIMLTMLDQREVGQALGSVDYLMKPIEPRVLTRTLHRYIDRQCVRVLVVEDDVSTRLLVKRTLQEVGHHVVEAENGQIGLDLLDEAEPDIIILDLMMPVMDGFTFLDRLRDHGKHASTPVIVATARELSTEERADLNKVAECVRRKGPKTRAELVILLGQKLDELIEKRSVNGDLRT